MLKWSFHIIGSIAIRASFSICGVIMRFSIIGMLVLIPNLETPMYKVHYQDFVSLVSV